MQKIKFLIILVSYIFLLSCKSKILINENRLNNQQIQILESFFKNFKVQYGEGEKYVVSPKIQEFEFNSFAKNEMSKIIKDHDFDVEKRAFLLRNAWTLKYFDKLKDSINKENKNKFLLELSDLSSSNKANYVFYISGFSKNMVFITMFDYCNFITIENLKTKKFYNKKHNFNSIQNYLVTFNQGKLDSIKIIDAVFREYQCNDNDVRINE